MESRNLSLMLETAVVAARLAGRHALEQMQYARSSVKGTQYRELVTQVDGECQKIAVDRIRETFPDHGFIGEEGEGNAIFKRVPSDGSDLWWCIDPIDGTNNYAHGLPIFAVSIGVLHAGRPILGAVFDPATESMFTAALGDHARLNERTITVSDETMNEFSHVGIDSHFDWLGHDADWTRKIMAATRFRDIGSTALQISYVAKGSLIATLQPGPKLWDIAAGVAIVEAAGGMVTDFEGKPIFPLDLQAYNGEKFKTLIASKAAHAELLQLVRP